MNSRQIAAFIKRRIRNLAFQARSKPHTAMAAYGYFELARLWARRHGDADLEAAVCEAKNYILEVAA